MITNNDRIGYGTDIENIKGCNNSNVLILYSHALRCLMQDSNADCCVVAPCAKNVPRGILNRSALSVYVFVLGIVLLYLRRYFL